MGTALRKAMKREAKQFALSVERTPEARKERIKLASAWIKRGNNTGMFHNPKHMDKSKLSTSQAGVGGRPVAMRIMGARSAMRSGND